LLPFFRGTNADQPALFQARKLTWSWFAGVEKPGVYEIDWQADENLDRIALALECWKVAVIDVSKVPALQGKR
jgi:transducin (beta)-like 1